MRGALADITNRERRHSVPTIGGVPKKCRPYGSNAAAGDLVAFVDASFRSNDAAAPAVSRRRRATTVEEPPQPAPEVDPKKKPLFVITGDADWENKVQEEVQKRHAQLLVDLEQTRSALAREQHVQVAETHPVFLATGERP